MNKDQLSEDEIKDQVRRAEQQLAALIVGGLESGSAIPADGNYWNNKRAALKRRHDDVK